MPRVSRFRGISIYLYHLDHPPPHFEAEYGEFLANVAIADGRILEGRLPPKAARLVRRWASLRRAELQATWDRARANLPLERIPGLDDDPSD